MVKKVLFLSSANGARSQMAEALLRALAGDAFDAYSAGSVPHELHPLALAVMAERGIDIGDQRPQGLREFIGATEFDHVITVCDRDEKACLVVPGRGAREYWPMVDPATAEGSAEERLVAFREARDHLEARIRSWLRERNYRAVRELSSAGTGAAS